MLTRTALTLVLLLGFATAADASVDASVDASADGAGKAAADARGHHDQLTTVDGRGGGTLALTGFEGDRVTFRIHATARPDDPVRSVDGTFTVTHVRPDGTLMARFAGTVDCLMKGGGTAVLTGRVTSGSAPGFPPEQQPLGHEIGLTVTNDGGRGHLGWSWLVMGFHDMEYCTGTAPVFAVTDGRFRVSGPDWTSPSGSSAQEAAGAPAVRR
jgi:hypothetical protein